MFKEERSSLLSLLRFKSNMVSAVVLNILFSVSRILFAFLLMHMTDNLIAGALSTFVKNIFFAAGVVIMQSILMQLSARSVNKYVNKYMIWLRKCIMKGIVKLPLSAINTETIESYKTLLNNEILYFEDGFIRARVDIVSAIIFLIISCIAIAKLNCIFLLILLATVSMSFLLPNLFNNSVKKANERFLSSNENMVSSNDELVNGNRTIQSFGARKLVETLFLKHVILAHKEKESFQNYMTFTNSILVLVSLFVTFLVFLTGGIMVNNDVITIGALIAVVQMSSNIMQPVTEIMYNLNELNSCAALKSKISGIAVVESIEEGNVNADNSMTKSIDIHNVSYQYDVDSQGGIYDLNITFDCNKSYAIVGQNGSGKSTLLKLLTGEIEGYKGVIRIGGYDSLELSSEDRFRMMNYIGQQSFLFDADWKDNVTLFGSNEFTQDESYIKIPGMDSILESTRSVLEMSGGEMQKVLLLRALNVTKQYFIVDEIDSATDSEAKREINCYINSMMNGTRIVVTHNIDDSLSAFDEIVHMDKGRIIERGNLDALLAFDSEFKKKYHGLIKNAILVS